MKELQLPLKKEWGFTMTRLKTNEYEAFLKASIMMGTTRSRLLRKMIRKFIQEGPEMLSHDLDAVREVTSRLAVSGRELNQLVKELREGTLDQATINPKLFEEIRTQIRELKHAIGEVVERSRNRWV